MAKTKKSTHLNPVDVIFLIYLVCVIFIVLTFGWGHEYFFPVIAAHGVFTAVICLLARFVNPRSNAFLRLVRAGYPVLLLVYLYSESGWINNLFFESPLDSIYIALEKLVFRGEPYITLPLRFDHRFLVEYFHFAYFTYYFYFPVIGEFFYVKDREFFEEFIFAGSLTLLSCYLLFIFFPAIGPIPLREDLYPGFFPRIMDLIYYIDAPGGAFPSSHVAVALVCVVMTFRRIRALGVMLLPLLASLIFSTVYCRYHYAVDALAGCIYGALMIWISDRLYRPMASTFPGIYVNPDVA